MSDSRFRMTPTVVHVLLSLESGPRHGYSLIREIAKRTNGVLSLGPSSLYYALDRMESAGLIAEWEGTEADVSPHEHQRRYFRLTDSGREELRREVRNLSNIVDEARARGLVR